MPEKQRPDDRSDWRGIGIGFTIPMMLAASVIVGCLIGYYLDQWLGTSPWLFLLFLALGITAGIRETMLLIRKINEPKK